MTNDRKAEVALQLFVFGIRKKIKSTLESHNRDLGNIAKESGISLDELKDFIGPIVREAVNEMFPSRTVSSVKPGHTWHE